MTRRWRCWVPWSRTWTRQAARDPALGPGLDDLEARPGARAGWPGRAAGQRAEAWQALAAAPSRGAAAWLRAAVAGGVVAGLASITSLIATSMLARLARGPVPGRRAGGQPGGHPAGHPAAAGQSAARAVAGSGPSRAGHPARAIPAAGPL